MSVNASVLVPYVQGVDPWPRSIVTRGVVLGRAVGDDDGVGVGSTSHTILSPSPFGALGTCAAGSRDRSRLNLDGGLRRLLLLPRSLQISEVSVLGWYGPRIWRSFRDLKCCAHADQIRVFDLVQLHQTINCCVEPLGNQPQGVAGLNNVGHWPRRRCWRRRSGWRRCRWPPCGSGRRR